MKLQYFRMFLEPIKQQSLFPDKQKSRTGLLREVFAKDAIYKSGSLALSVYWQEGDYAVAHFGRKSSLTVNHPPEEGFEAESVETWPKVESFLNLSDDPDKGQSLAVEVNTSVFRKPAASIEKVFGEVNKKLYSRGFELRVNAITEEQDFWEIVEETRGRLKKLTFSFESPNLFQTRDRLNDELAEAQKSYQSTRTSVSLENPEGNLNLPEGNQFIKQSNEYISKGGGEYELRLKGKKKISSKDSAKSRELGEIEFQIDLAAKDKKIFKEICDKVFEWLKS